ncbi:MAG TPA: DNA polymerase Y family protein [Azospirillum sp.]|nr:DNA polymerase Y family protein [Azospirillum sp.]
MARRILSLWLPRLTTDAWTRRRPEDGARPVAAVLAERGRQVVAAVNRVAGLAGVRPGQTLADARAIEPGLIAFDADPVADARLLERIASWALRYTPWTAADGPDGVVLDITGCAHLFGGEHGLLADLHGRLVRAGFELRAAIAGTPAAAWGVARALSPPRGERVIVPPNRQREALDPLPVAALRLPPAIVDELSAVGLRRIGDLHAIPRATLTARFGPEPARRLDQALGRLDEPVSPHRPVAPHAARLAFAEAISTPDDIARAVRRLLDELCRGLSGAQEGARRLELAAHRIDQKPDDAPQTIAIGTSRPTRDPAALMRLFAETLERIEPGPGIEVMTLSAPVAGPLGAMQTGLDGNGDDTALGELVDRLGNRLGDGAVLRLVPRQSWLPERAVAAAPALDAPIPPAPVPPLPWPADRPRPVRLLAPPEPVEVVAPVPDDPPMLFRWRGAVHRVRWADGPERLCPEWWRREGEPRDYYRVEDMDGSRFWLFRLGLYQPGVKARWFVHGFFG